MKLVIDEDRPHVIKSETGGIVAVLVDYPLSRKEIGKRIVEGFNSPCKPTSGGDSDNG